MQNKEIGVIGLGKFGFNLALSLFELGHNVVGIDGDQHAVQRASEHISTIYSGDATNKNILSQLRFQDFDSVVVSVGHSMEASLLISLNLLDLKVKNIIAKAISSEHGLILERLGVSTVIQPEIEIARQLANRINNPGMLDLFPFAGGTLLQKVFVDKWSGMTLKELALPSQHGIISVACKKTADKDYSFVPDPEMKLTKGDELLLIGPSKAIMDLKA